MKPVSFPQANATKRYSTGEKKRYFVSAVSGGKYDGDVVGIFAWIPSRSELAKLNSGAPIFVGTSNSGRSAISLDIDEVIALFGLVKNQSVK